MNGMDVIALLAKRRKAKTATASTDTGAEESDDAGTAEPMGPKAELAAYKKLKTAMAGDDDAAGVAALKQFLTACGAYESDEE